MQGKISCLLRVMKGKWKMGESPLGNQRAQVVGGSESPLRALDGDLPTTRGAIGVPLRTAISADMCVRAMEPSISW